MKKLILLALLISPLALADAPVVSITPASPATVSGDVTDAAPATPVATVPAMQLTLDQRVAMLERQISAMNQIDLVNQVSQLEQQVQDLQGQVQVLSHTLQTVQAQTTSQYADLDKRLDDASATAPATTTPASTSANSAKANSSSSSVSATTSTTSNSTDSVAEQTLYDTAYKNIREQKNAAGLEGMKKYLDKYPDGKYAASAHYWLGQVYLLKGDDKSVKNAVTEFDTVIKKFPKTDKAREASLKLGFAYLLQSKTSEARTQFRKVMKDYPATSEAKMAESRLAQLSQQFPLR